MRYLLTTLAAIITFAMTTAQDVTALIKEGDRLEAVPDEMGSFRKFKEVLKIQPANLYALVKCSELCSRIGKRQANKATMYDYYKGAVIYAETALKVNPSSSDANCVMAIAQGRIALSKSGKEKIAASKDIKRYAELAIKNDAANFKAWHVLGRWHYEVSNLSGLERAVAKVFYGGIPAASLKEAIKAFEKAKVLDPLFVLNYYELARAYKRNDEKQKAISTLNFMLTLGSRTEDDDQIKKDGRDLLKKWE
jgi:tetratricopeptide (TPR) repeat protein